MNDLTHYLNYFSEAESRIKRLNWYNEYWSCCSGLWETKEYGNTVLIRITKINWTNTFPITCYEGGEIQYAAWIDSKLLAVNKIRFELHIFNIPGIEKKKVKKSDFTQSFRDNAHVKIMEFGNHDIDRGPAVPYAGEFKFSNPDELISFIVNDFINLYSVSDIIDNELRKLKFP
jgi:hypothetical protein